MLIRILLPYIQKEDFLNEVYMAEENYNTLVGLLKNKKKFDPSRSTRGWENFRCKETGIFYKWAKRMIPELSLFSSTRITLTRISLWGISHKMKDLSLQMAFSISFV